MIHTVMSVCGDRKYYDMAEYSIPRFLLENAGSKLTVFSDKPERLLHLADKFKDLLEIRDFQESIDNLDGEHRENADIIIEKSNKPWEHYGLEHAHKYVAVLPVLAEAYITSTFILKIDVDSWFKGDLLIAVISKLLEEYKIDGGFRDVYLVERPDNGTIKTFGNEWPGVGFLLWYRGSRFVGEYVKRFNGNEQETILVNLCHQRNVTARTFKRWEWHTVYPWIKAEETGIPFDENELTEPYYIHIHVSHAREKLFELNGKYNG